MRSTNREVKACIASLYEELFAHDGYADMRIEMRILRRGQKEVIIHCGKQYRFIVDYRNPPLAAAITAAVAVADKPAALAAVVERQPVNVATVMARPSMIGKQTPTRGPSGEEPEGKR